MAQTKRKRRNKHRGNAVGAVEARGRTSKPRTDVKPAKGGRGGVRTQATARQMKPPSWQSAAMKAGFGGVMLFLFARFGLLGDKAETGSALTLAAMAMLFYTPIMYLTDRWIYQRKLRQAAGGGAKR
jgi:hypothetical protein